MLNLKTSENAFTVACRGNKKSKCGLLRPGRVTQQCYRALVLFASRPVSLVMSVTLSHYIIVLWEEGEAEEVSKTFLHTRVWWGMCVPAMPS